MTIPKTAIEKAIEGGWHITDIRDEYSSYLWTDYGKVELRENDILIFGTDEKGVRTYEQSSWQAIALDLTFWQALGKSCGWEEDVKMKVAPENIEFFVWKFRAHDFYDLILQGKDTAAFWAELLQEKETN